MVARPTFRYLYPVASPSKPATASQNATQWWSPVRNDTLLCLHSWCTNSAQSAGYTKLWDEGWVLPPAARPPPTPPPACSFDSTNETYFACRNIPAFAWPNSTSPPDGCPLPPSPLGLEFTGLSCAPRNASGSCGVRSDTWYPTVGADGVMWSSWTDGAVKGLSSSSAGPHATTGWSVLSGKPNDGLAVGLSGVVDRPATPLGGRYPCASFSLDGVWYYGTYSLSDGSEIPQTNHTAVCGRNAWCIGGPFIGFHTSACAQPLSDSTCLILLRVFQPGWEKQLRGSMVVGGDGNTCHCGVVILTHSIVTIWYSHACLRLRADGHNQAQTAVRRGLATKHSTQEIIHSDSNGRSLHAHFSSK